MDEVGMAAKVAQLKVELARIRELEDEADAISVRVKAKRIELETALALVGDLAGKEQGS